MIKYFPSRSLAAKHAARNGLKAFQTKQPMPNVDPKRWIYEERPVGPGIEYANMFASDKDWIHHCEVTEQCVPILVVTCLREEIIEEIPSLFKIEPLSWEAWEAERRAYPALQRHVPAPTTRAQTIVTHSANTNAINETIKRGRSGGAKAICREVYLSMRGADKKSVIAACVARGIFIGTAAARYTDLYREIEGK